MSQSISLSIPLPSVSPSPWSETLGTQRIPSDVQADDIRGVISHSNLILSEVDNGIDRVQEALELLHHRRDEICEHISTHKAFLSPIRRLPNETLAEIFIYCLPWFSKKKKVDKRSSFHQDQAPLLLGQICSRWRAIVLSTQELWSFIQIEFGKRTLQHDVECMSVWLERSGTYPLSFILGERNDSVFSDVEWHGPSMVETILPTSNRWQHMEIHGLRDTIIGLSPVRDKLPLLQSISVRMYDPNFQGIICDAFELAPALRTVYLGYGTVPSFFMFPWAHLVEFSSHGDPVWPETCLQLLRYCPNLTSCAFWTLVDLPIESSNPPLQHRQLLNFHIPPESNIGGFFDCLTLPALHSVRLEPIGSTDWPGPQFLDLLSRSSCTITKFAWALKSAMVENIIRCLESMPDLEELEITPNLGYSLSDLLHSLSQRAPGEECTSLCPKLRVVQYKSQFYVSCVSMTRKSLLRSGVYKCKNYINVVFDRNMYQFVIQTLFQ